MQERKLDAFDSWCLRKILGIRGVDFITNAEVRDHSQQEPVSNTICWRRLSWLGHVSCLKACKSGAGVGTTWNV